MRADFFDKRDKFEKLRQNDVGASVIRFGEISPLWQNLKSLGQYFESNEPCLPRSFGPLSESLFFLFKSYSLLSFFPELSE